MAWTCREKFMKVRAEFEMQLVRDKKVIQRDSTSMSMVCKRKTIGPLWNVKGV